MEKAVRKFMNLPSDELYTAIRISEGGYAVDAVIKVIYAGKGELICSRDVKQYILFQEYPEVTIEMLKALYKAVGVKKDHADKIINSLEAIIHEMEIKIMEQN